VAVQAVNKALVITEAAGTGGLLTFIFRRTNDENVIRGEAPKN
jgi:hypothetical protein